MQINSREDACQAEGDGWQAASHTGLQLALQDSSRIQAGTALHMQLSSCAACGT